MVKPTLDLHVKSSLIHEDTHIIDIQLSGINEELLQEILAVLKRVQELVTNAGGTALVRQPTFQSSNVGPNRSDG